MAGAHRLARPRVVAWVICSAVWQEIPRVVPVDWAVYLADWRVVLEVVVGLETCSAVWQARPRKSVAPAGTFGELLNGSLQSGREPKVAPSASEEAVAGLMLRAMIQAAKCDGDLDDNERQRLMENLNESSPDEIEFVNRELSSPVNIDGLVSQVPAGLEQQVYAMSVMGIVLDNKSEAQYLDKLAGAMNIEPAAINQIHDQLGVQHIYA